MRCKIPAADTQLKLNDSIIRYKGKPVYVRTDSGTLHLYELTNTQKCIETVKNNNPDLDISTVPLGYVNFLRNNLTTACYVSRIPWRRTKQGLDYRSVRTRPNSVRTDQVLFCQAFIDMVDNKYPSLDKCLETLNSFYKIDKEHKISMAFHRDIALEINDMGIIYVYYKASRVGWIQPNTKIVTVPSDAMGFIISRFLEGYNWEVK